MTKLFILPTGQISPVDAVYTLIADTGEAHWSHVCTSPPYAKGDLLTNRPERIAEMNAKYGAWELLHFSEQSEITEDELVERNRAHAAANGYAEEATQS